MRTRWDGKGSACGGHIPKGADCDYEKWKGIRHFNCPDPRGEFVELRDTIPEKSTAYELADKLGFK